MPAKKKTGAAIDSKLAKTTAAKPRKPKPVVTEPIIVEEPTSLNAEVSPVAISMPVKPADKPVESDNDVIPFMIPYDPREATNMWWERSINGVILRLKRGKMYQLPRYIVRFIEDRIKIQRLSDESMAQYNSDRGVKIG